MLTAENDEWLNVENAECRMLDSDILHFSTLDIPHFRHSAFSIDMATARPREPRLSHDRRILLMALASALPGAGISLIFLWTGDYTPKVQWTLTVLIVTFCLGFAFALRERVVLPLQTLSNLLAALGEGDFSIRARGARGGDPLGEVMIEVNTLVETLRQRRDALDATTTLRQMMAAVDRGA